MAAHFATTPFDIDGVFWSDGGRTLHHRCPDREVQAALQIAATLDGPPNCLSFTLDVEPEAEGLADPARSSDAEVHLEGKAPLTPESGRPPANIVLLSDGTGNGASNLFKTNVRRLYEALDVADPKNPKHPRQFAYYDDGVGTSSFRPLALLGGAFGVGLARNIREMYAFLCRTYRPGDRIYAFGFSRGAFTIRTLVALILAQGIIKYDGDEAELQRKVRAAYREFRRNLHTRNQLLIHLRGPRDRLIKAWHRLRRIGPEKDYKAANNHPSVHIEFVGVWDTVDAYGLPIEELVRAIDRFILPLNMANGDLHPRVRHARQALALDEQRQTFHPRLWNEEADTKGRIRQVWFAGVHSDVGGGYPDDGLAHVTLNWMLDELAMLDGSDTALRLRPEAKAFIVQRADENAPLHDSRRGLASYYRYRPRDIEILRDQAQNVAKRYVVKLRKPIIHESALRRIKIGQDGYAPISSTLDFEVAKVGGGIVPAADYLGIPEGPISRCFDEGRQGAYDFVWWRRICYFAALAITVALAAFPIYLEADRCEGWACFLSPLISGIGGVLPGFLSGWTAAAAANPSTFLILMAALAATYVAGSHLEGRVADTMRKVWYRLDGVRPSGIETPKSDKSGLVNATIRGLRTAGWYIAFWAFARRTGLPVLASIATLCMTYALASVGVMAALESSGSICQTPEVIGSGSLPVKSDFSTSKPCNSTPALLLKGGHYRIEVVIPAMNPWLDGGPAGLPASPNGLINGPNLLMTVWAPIRRHWGQPWFKLMARVGAYGADVQAPDWRLVCAGSSFVYRAEITSNREGPLFLYVNDGVPLGLTGLIYGNNQGTARVTVLDISLQHHAAGEVLSERPIGTLNCPA
jgi:uncharacterized protein (DUF2235 family)